ncbi:MAG: efflux RND transporter periplasmic adaptor subunit [Chlamydiota bacterium]|nr:efflux RND transporter periplasmic adaptor subunit [Chlamydiota bacterium]
MSKIVFLIPIAAVVALVAIFIAQENALSDPNIIKLSGNIEVTEVELSFEIPGRVKERLVSEGQTVSKGQTVAYLDSQRLSQEVALRQAELRASKAALLELKEGFLPEEIAQAEAKLSQAKAELNRLASDYERQKRLFDGDVISSREFDISNSAYEVAKAKVLESQENLALLNRGIRPEKITQAEANVSKSSQALAIAETKLHYASLESPIAGYVLSDNIESGEFAAPGTPIVTIGNLNDVWLRAYVDESDLGKVQLQQAVKITTDTYPDKIYEGKVVFISPEAEFTPKNVQTEKERVKLVYRIKVDVSNPNLELKPGMPADGLIIVNTESSK